MNEAQWDELEHALGQRLVGLLETHLNLDPCPAIRLSQKLAAKMRSWLEDVAVPSEVFKK